MEVKIVWDFLVQNSETIRNLVLIVGTPVAIILAVWRSIVAQKQADIAQAGLLSDRYQRAVEMLGNEGTAIRIGGIHALLDLVREHSDEYLEKVWNLLNAYKRIPEHETSENEREALRIALIVVRSKRDSRLLLKSADRWRTRLRLWLIWLKNLCKR